MTSPCLNAALHLSRAFGWHAIAVQPHGKTPITPHGVKDATTDERAIRRMWAREPDANVAIATGAPGPQVLDIDKLVEAAAVLKALEDLGAPESATARGRHLFLAGIARATISLGYGELRGRGSYVVVPPSVHPSGKLYTWLVEPDGHKLPPVPAELLGQAQPAGTGIMADRAGRVPHGERHDYLKGRAVQLVRGGTTDVPTLETMLRVDYELNCEQTPAARAAEFADLAEWAAGTRIASKERNQRAHREQHAKTEHHGGAPATNASLAEHRAYVHRLAGLTPDVEIGEVRRFGNRLVDGMQIRLSDGAVVDFARQAEVAQRGTWHRAVVAATSGRARPPGLKEPELVDLLRSLCLVAQTERHVTEAEAHADTLREFLALCEPVGGHTLESSVSRFTLIDALRQRERFDPFDRNSTARPALVVDTVDSARYLRGGELWDYFRQRGAGIGSREFPGRMAMAGLEHVPVNGREAMPLDPSLKRRKVHAVLYRVAGGDE